MALVRSVLIIGGSGFVGTHLARRLREGFKVFATYGERPIAIPGVSCIPFDSSNRNWVKRVVYTAAPDFVIYAAGPNDPAWATANPRESEQAHASGPAAVLNSSSFFQSKFIYLSNCYVFDGERGYYRENDIPLASNVLGKSKLAGENAIRGKSVNWVVIRSSPVFGRGNGRNLSSFDRLRMQLDRGQRAELPTQELHSFAPVEGLVELVVRCVESGTRNRVLHYGGLTKLSHFSFGQRLAQRFGYDPTLVAPAPHRGRGKSGDAPEWDFSLNSSAAIDLLKIEPLLLEQGLDLVEQKLVAGA